MAQDILYDYYVTDVGDMLSGYIDNMSDEEIDRDLKLFTKFAKALGVKNYDDMVVLVDGDGQFYITDINEVTLDTVPYMKDTQNGIDFYFFQNEDACRQFIGDCNDAIYKYENGEIYF